MKLYGIAIAAVPEKGNTSIINIMCNPIAMSDDKRTKFEILHELAFKEKFDFTNPEETIACFKKLTTIIGKVVELQKQSLATQGLGYRPVAMEIGQDSRNPLNQDPLYLQLLHTQLFGKRIYPHNTEKEIKEKLLEYFSDDKKFGNVTAENLDEHLRKDGYVKEVHDGILIADSMVEKALPNAKKLRAEYLEQHPQITCDLTETRKKLAELLDDCTIKWGSFARYGVNTEQTELDRKLIELKPRFENGDEEARYELVNLAKAFGRDKGVEANEFPYLFDFTPDGYKTDKKMQDELPRYSFFHWDEAFKDAFYDGFDSTYRGAQSRLMKLPLDPQNPPFTDPCADMIRDQFQILDGVRPENKIEDSPWRKKIAEAAADISDMPDLTKLDKWAAKETIKHPLKPSTDTPKWVGRNNKDNNSAARNA